MKLYSLWLILFITIFVNNVVYLASIKLVLNFLQSHYPDKWKELGEPSLWWNNSPRNSFRLIGFLFKNPDNIQDSKFTLLRKLTLSLFIFSMVGFVALVIGFLGMFLQGTVSSL